MQANDARCRPPARSGAIGAVVRLGLALTLLTTGLNTHALQLIEARDGVAVEAVLSMREPTRIRIEGAPITDVFGSIYVSHCAASPNSTMGPIGSVTTTPLATSVQPGGEVVLECDREKGEIYLRPVGPSTKPVNLFVASASATYTLLLHRSDTPADTIVIRDRSARPASASTTRTVAATGSASSTIRAMKSLLVAMATDQAPPEFQVTEIHKPVQLWTSVQFTQIRLYEGNDWIGEKYLLINTGSNDLVLAEQEFDREGGSIAGVAIEQHLLRPGQSTNVYVIRRGEAP